LDVAARRVGNGNDVKYVKYGTDGKGLPERGDLFAAFLEEVLEEGREAGEAVAGVDVVLDDVESEIVEAGESPDGHAEEECVLQRGGFDEEQRGGDDADQEEEGAFDFDCEGGFEVGHGREGRRDEGGRALSGKWGLMVWREFTRLEPRRQLRSQAGA